MMNIGKRRLPGATADNAMITALTATAAAATNAASQGDQRPIVIPYPAG